MLHLGGDETAREAAFATRKTKHKCEVPGLVRPLESARLTTWPEPLACTPTIQGTKQDCGIPSPSSDRGVPSRLSTSSNRSPQGLQSGYFNHLVSVVVSPRGPKRGLIGA